MSIEPESQFDWAAAEALFNDTDDAPALVDDPRLSGPAAPVNRQPVLPPWLRSRQALTDQLRWATSHAAHVTAFHAIRLPFYGGKLALRSPRGLWRTVRFSGRWVFDLEGEAVRQAAVRREDADEYLHLSRQRDGRVRLRVWVGGFTMLATCAAGAVLTAAPGWLQLAVAAGTVGALGLAGGSADRPLVGTAVVSTRVARLSSDVVVHALAVLGIKGINAGLRADDRAVGFPAPIAREGQGWRADIDLPAGVTASEVIAKRENLAAALSRPLGCVWPEGQPDVHPGRLVLWVGDQDMAKAKNPPWPLLKVGKVNLFEPFAFGTDPRGRKVTITLMFASMVIGSIPRMGKTYALRLALLAAALDPRAELHCYDLKGTGDFRPLQPVAHRYRAGDDTADIEYALASMREVQTEMQRRTKVIRELPQDLCPESKVTDALASNRKLRLHPIMIGIDECQRWFEHPEHGDELRSICEDLVRRGPALGIIVAFGTQRPDAKSLPPVISSNVVLRYALKVMNHQANDMILGSGAYSSGIQATMFARSDRGIGYLAGEGDDPQITRTHRIDAPDAELVVVRARAARDLAGTLSGYALGEASDLPDRPTYDVLTDILAVLSADEEKAHSDTIAARLADLRPDAYAGWDKSNISAALKPHDVKTGQVWATDPATGNGSNRFGIKRADIVQAITDRDGKRRK
jgi:DNA segregation ATPase FtsK/SpoIIIE, S-DNA-T family